MSTQRPKLILGSANFGIRPYGTVTERLSLNEVGTIMTFARKNGITIMEGSELYEGNEEIYGDLHFDLIYKVKHPYNLGRTLELLGRKNVMGLLYHHSQESRAQDLLKDSRALYIGASIYSTAQLIGTEEMIEVPLNLEDKRFEKVTAPCKIVRSVFGRGELLKKHTVKECLDFVKNNTTVHGVIVGVDSIAQLQEIVEEWNK